MAAFKMNILLIVIISIHVIFVSPLTENPPTEGIDGVLYKFAKTGQPTTLICEAMSIGSADICTFTR